MSITAIPGTPRITAALAASVAARDDASAGGRGKERAKAALRPLPLSFGSSSSKLNTARADPTRDGLPAGAIDAIGSCEAHTRARDADSCGGVGPPNPHNGVWRVR